MDPTSDNYLVVWRVHGRICAETFLMQLETTQMIKKISDLVHSEYTGWIEVYRYTLDGKSEKAMVWYRE